MSTAEQAMATALIIATIVALLATLTAAIGYMTHLRRVAARATLCPDCGGPGRVEAVDLDGSRWMTCPWDGARWSAGVAR